MKLTEIVETSELVAGASGRLEKIDHLARLLRRLESHEIETAVAYLSGALRQGRIGVGPAAIRDAAAGPPAAKATLSLHDVDSQLERIECASGPGSGSERARLLGELFTRATQDERRFLARLLLGELRQGALAGLMLEALARAADLTAAEVRRAVMLEGDLGPIARAALTEGRAGLARFELQLFRPLQPMLASPAEGVNDALEAFDRAAFEYKLDGARVQVHRSGDEVRVFTRHLHDVTAAVPELTEAVAALPLREVILDGEALAFRPDGRPQPFQVTMRRFGRKLEVERMRGELPLRGFFFDCLRLDGENLIDRPASERFAALAGALPANLSMPRIVTDDPGQAEQFLRESIAGGHEGVMAKSLEAPYAAGARGSEWLKIKLIHTLDLVVLAVEWGHGRRRGWLSNLHLGARDPASGQFVMLGKTFKGLTDEMLAWQTQKLLELETHRDQHTVYVRPELVVEVSFNDVQASPIYPAGMALRFARVKRYRPDKQAAEADTLDLVRAIHLSGSDTIGATPP
jgi:DNA ligase-1